MDVHTAQTQSTGSIDGATLIEDRNEAGVYRVEYIGPEGEVDVTIFAGPTALDRAITYAGTYYERWSDPQALAGY